ncbi:MAG: hypothetical protein AMJ62_08350 [Myxococcales bacterium SG8_38]|nr:MAG: hypothetical protein AMJ62_08350 [Myxococcales bacterium SG8_38]
MYRKKLEIFSATEGYFTCRPAPTAPSPADLLRSHGATPMKHPSKAMKLRPIAGRIGRCAIPNASPTLRESATA